MRAIKKINLMKVAVDESTKMKQKSSDVSALIISTPLP